MTRTRLLQNAVAALAVLATVAATGCGGSGDDGVAPSEAPVVLATTGIWADVTRNLACDGEVRVEALMPDGADPHAFEPSLADRARLESASLVVANGLGLEETLEDTLDAAESSGRTIFRVGDHVAPLLAERDDVDAEEGGEEHAGADAQEDEHAHEGEDPHIWLDPQRVLAVLPTLAEALVAEGGAPRGSVERCLRDYRATLRGLDEEVFSELNAIRPERRVLVTNHDALRYFAERYGFEVLGTVIPSPSSLAATNPAELERLAGAIADTGVPAIFSEAQHTQDDIAALARRVGDVEVVTLHTGSLGPPESGADTYTGLIRTDAALIAGALR